MVPPNHSPRTAADATRLQSRVGSVILLQNLNLAVGAEAVWLARKISMSSANDLVKDLPTLAQVMRRRSRNAAFLITLITDFEVKVTPDGRRKLELKLSVDMPVLRTT